MSESNRRGRLCFCEDDLCNSAVLKSPWPSILTSGCVVKNTIVQVDATPFKKYYAEQYDVELGKKKQKEAAEGAAVATEAKKKSRHVLATLKKRQANRVIDSHVADQFTAGRLLAVVSSRPGQSGRADGYILEGKELEFYLKKLEKRKK